MVYYWFVWFDAPTEVDLRMCWAPESLKDFKERKPMGRLGHLEMEKWTKSGFFLEEKLTVLSNGKPSLQAQQSFVKSQKIRSIVHFTSIMFRETSKNYAILHCIFRFVWFFPHFVDINIKNLLFAFDLRSSGGDFSSHRLLSLRDGLLHHWTDAGGGRRSHVHVVQ